jgi:hypothetical protein
VTLMVGSSIPADAGTCSGAGPVVGCPSPAAVGEGAGVGAPGAVAGCPSPVAGGDGADAAGAGAALAGAGGDCGDGVGAVWAKAPAQSDEIKKHVEASKRGRNDTESPPQGKRTTIHPCALLRTVTVFDRRPGIFPHPSRRVSHPHPATGFILASKYAIVKNYTYEQSRGHPR